MGMKIRIRGTAAVVVASVALGVIAPMALADGIPPPPPPPQPPPSPSGGGGGSSGGGGGGGSTTPPASTPTTPTTPVTPPVQPVNNPRNTARVVVPVMHRNGRLSDAVVVPPVQSAVQVVKTQPAAATASSSRRPWLLLGAGVVLLGLALALLLWPAGLRVRRRGLPSASTR